MSAVVSEYQGKPTLNLVNDDVAVDRFPFSFGLAKAKKIMANLPAIEQFVATEGKSVSAAVSTDPELVAT